MSLTDSTTVANPYATNLYGTSFTGAQTYPNYSTDFMANATNYNDVALQQYYQSLLANQPQQDTFQREGSSNNGIKFALAGGGLTMGGLFAFGKDKLSPFKDGKFDDKFLKTLEDPTKITTEIDNIKANKIAEIFKNKSINNIYQYRAIQEFAETGIKPKGVTLPRGLTQEQAKTLIKEVNEEILKINPEQIRQQVLNTHSLEGSTKELSRLNGIKSKLTALPDNISVDDLTKHIKDNAKLYGITAEGEALESAAKQMAQQGKAGLLTTNANAITAQTTVVDGLRSNLTNQVKTYWDDTAKALKEGAPENIQKAVKNFKWKTAGKWGAIAAGVGLALGWMFGNNKA